MLSNYVGQIKHDSIELIEILFAQIFEGVVLIKIPREDNRSEVQKMEVKVIYEFLRLIQRVMGDYKCSVLLTERNYGKLNPLIEFVIENQA